METKGVTCKIPLDLHNRITEEIRQNESTMSKFIEQIILEHYEKGAITMGKTRTMAFQVSEELFQQIKDYLARYEQVYHRKLTQKEFVISLIEQALEEADEEFEAAEAGEDEDAAEDTEINDDNLEKNISKLADLLGHSSIETTRIYIMESGAEHERLLNRMHLLLQITTKAVLC